MRCHLHLSVLTAEIKVKLTRWVNVEKGLLTGRPHNQDSGIAGKGLGAPDGMGPVIDAVGNVGDVGLFHIGIWSW